MKEERKSKVEELIEMKQFRQAFVELSDILDHQPDLESFHFANRIFERMEFDFIELASLKVAFLRSITIEPILPILKAKCYQAKIKPTFYIGGYNQIQQEILDSNSNLYGFHPDILIIVARLHELCPKLVYNYLELSRQEVNIEIDGIVQTMDSLLLAFRNHSDVPVVLHNFELPEFPALGILDASSEIGQKETLRVINSELIEIIRKYKDVYLLDYDGLLSRYGKQNCFDAKMWYLAKSPLSAVGLIGLATEYIKYFKAIKGLNKKCLVLDLDNTLWGGILGEDGFDGIQLGPDYPGSAFVDFQKAVLRLYNRGIILALNSKNNEYEVMEVIEKHPYMVLRKEHFATMRINWQDKVQNMREIAADLNIGIDSLVFMDDSSFECELMRQELPEVRTIQLPKEPIHYPEILLSLGDFDTLTYSEEDRKRGELYRSQIQRKELEKQSTSLEYFYHSLEMELITGKANEKTIPRIAQLTQRTNQFNLTTKRYSEADIARFVKSQDWNVYYLQLKDKFGDNGIIGVCITEMGNDSWNIDTFLLSCRVIGRTVETAFLNFLFAMAQKNGPQTIFADYIPTKKNGLVKDLWKEHGFQLMSENNGETHWKIDLPKVKLGYPEWFKITILEE